MSPSQKYSALYQASESRWARSREYSCTAVPGAVLSMWDMGACTCRKSNALWMRSAARVVPRTYTCWRM